MTRFLCAVSSCMYLAEHELAVETEGFPVCALHHHGAVQSILDAGRLPGAYWTKNGFPIVMPCGVLDDSDFEPKPAGPDATSALDCPLVARIPDGPSDAFEAYDLTRGL